MMLTANKNAYKYIVLLTGLIVLTGNFFPELPIWGFDYYIIGESFNSKFFPIGNNTSVFFYIHQMGNSSWLYVEWL